jgi:hypothetical protein
MAYRLTEPKKKGLHHRLHGQSKSLVQEPLVLSQVPRHLPHMSVFLGESCLETEVSEQLYSFSLCALWFKFFFFIRLTALRRTTFQLRKLNEFALGSGGRILPIIYG